MKTKEELNAIKNEVETMSRKLNALTEEELEQVTGGGDPVRVRGEDIARIHTTEAVAVLQSKVAGVNIIPSQGQPGESSYIKLR